MLVDRGPEVSSAHRDLKDINHNSLRPVRGRRVRWYTGFVRESLCFEAELV